MTKLDDSVEDLDDIKSECVIPDFLIESNSAERFDSNSYVLSPRIGKLASLSTHSVSNNFELRRQEFEPRTSKFAPINVRNAAALAAQKISRIPQSLASVSEKDQHQAPFNKMMKGNS